MAAILCLLLFVCSIGGCDSTPADPYDEPILTETGESATYADIITEGVSVTTTETSAATTAATTKATTETTVATTKATVATTKATTATTKETATTTKATTAATKTTTETTKSEVTVWIPRSGSKYHSNASCSNMKNPSQVTKSRAIEMGYSACKKCYN